MYALKGKNLFEQIFAHAKQYKMNNIIKSKTFDKTQKSQVGKL